MRSENIREELMRSRKQEKRSSKEGEEASSKRRSKKLKFERMEDDWGEQRRHQEPLQEESMVEKDKERGGKFGQSLEETKDE